LLLLLTSKRIRTPTSKPTSQTLLYGLSIRIVETRTHGNTCMTRTKKYVNCLSLPPLRQRDLSRGPGGDTHVTTRHSQTYPTLPLD